MGLRSRNLWRLYRREGYGLLGMVRETLAVIAQEMDAVRPRTDRHAGKNLIPAATDPALPDAELGICLDRALPGMCFFWDVVPSAVTRAEAAGADGLNIQPTGPGDPQFGGRRTWHRSHGKSTQPDPARGHRPARGWSADWMQDRFTLAHDHRRH